MAAKLRQIWKSPLIAADPIVWRRDLAPELKTKIKAFFVGYGQPGPGQVLAKGKLAKLTLGSFKESSNAQLKPIRQLELFKEKMKLEADAGMQGDDKKARLDDISRKLADLASS